MAANMTPLYACMKASMLSLLYSVQRLHLLPRARHLQKRAEKRAVALDAALAWRAGGREAKSAAREGAEERCAAV